MLYQFELPQLYPVIVHNLCSDYKFTLSIRDCMNLWWHGYCVEYITNVNIPVSTISTNTFSYCISTKLQGTILHNIVRKLDCQAIFVLSPSLGYHEHTIVFIAIQVLLRKWSCIATLYCVRWYFSGRVLIFIFASSSYHKRIDVYTQYKYNCRDSDIVAIGQCCMMNLLQMELHF